MRMSLGEGRPLGWGSLLVAARFQLAHILEEYHAFQGNHYRAGSYLTLLGKMGQQRAQ